MTSNLSFFYAIDIYFFLLDFFVVQEVLDPCLIMYKFDKKRYSHISLFLSTNSHILLLTFFGNNLTFTFFTRMNFLLIEASHSREEMYKLIQFLRPCPCKKTFLL